MCRRGCRNAGAMPAFWLIPEFPISRNYQCLLLIGIVCLSLNCGCTSSRTGRRFLVSNPLRPANSVSRAAEADVSAGRTRDRAARKASDLNHSDIRLIGDREESSADDAKAISAPNVDSLSNAENDSLPIQLPASGITLADLQVLAVENNPTLSQAQAAISAEQGFYRQAGLYPNPQIGYLNGTASNPAVKQSNGVFYSQEFVTAHKLQLAQNSASVEIKRYQWDHESQRLRILNDLKIRYYEVLGAQQAKQVTDEMVKIAEKGLKMAEQNFEAKHAARTDLLQARIHLETVRLTRDEAEHRYTAAWEQLATIVGIAQLAPVPIVGELTDDVPQLELVMCQQHLLANSPQIKSTECDLGHAWASYREARAQATPNITVQTVGEYDRATQAAIVTTLVALPFPIFNRNQGNIDKSSADIVAAQAEIARVQLVLRDQLALSFQRYNTSLRQTQRLREVILPSAKENLQLTEQVYASGERPFTDVLFAQQTYFQSQVSYLDALTELHKVVTEIQGLQLTGGLNPASIGGAIQNQPGGGTQRQRALLNEVQSRTAKQLLPAAQISQ